MVTICQLLANNDATALYRQTWPARFARPGLGRYGISLIEREQISLDESDSVAAYTFMDVSPEFYQHLYYLKKLGKKMVWIVDDDLWNWPYHAQPRDLLDAFRYDLADLLVVNNPELARAVGCPDKTVICPNLLPADFWPPIKPKKDGPRTLLWSGSTLVPGDLEYGKAVVEAIADKLYPRVLVHTMLGEHDGFAMSTRINAHPAVGFAEYARWLADFQPDIAVIPRLDRQFNVCKSPLKLLEMAAVGSFTFASDLPNYQRAVRAGIPATLLLGDATPADWVRYVESLLVRGTNKFDSHAQRTQRAALEHHSSHCQAAVTEWVNLYRRVLQ